LSGYVGSALTVPAHRTMNRLKITLNAEIEKNFLLFMISSF